MDFAQIKIALGAIKRLFYDSRPQKLGGHGKNIYIEYPLMFHNPSNIFLEDNTSIKAFKYNRQIYNEKKFNCCTKSNSCHR